MHKLHLSTRGDHCLICAAHFEKTYVKTIHHFQVYFQTQPIIYNQATITGSYTDLIGSSLRGPPILDLLKNS